MNDLVLYLDSSAIVKLIMPEPESRAMLGLLSDWPERASSTLARVEVSRAIRRIAARASVRRRAEDVLARIALIAVDEPVLARAATLDPSALPSLDALHLAAALSLGGDLGRFVTYDDRLGAAAAARGISVVAPAQRSQ